MNSTTNSTSPGVPATPVALSIQIEAARLSKVSVRQLAALYDSVSIARRVLFSLGCQPAFLDNGAPTRAKQIFAELTDGCMDFESAIIDEVTARTGVVGDDAELRAFMILEAEIRCRENVHSIATMARDFCKIEQCVGGVQ